MAVLPTVLINGDAITHENLEAFYLNAPFYGIKSISAKVMREKVDNRYNAPRASSRSRKGKTYEGSVTMAVEEWKIIRAAAIAAGGDDATDLAADTFTWIWLSGGTPVTMVWEKMEWLEDPMASEADDDAIDLEIPVIIGEIKYI